MSDVVFLAVIATVSPILMVVANYFVQRNTARQNWERQDAVAARVATAEALLETTNAAVVAHSDRVEVTLDEMQKLGQVTHDLVNSDKTTAMEREKAGLKRERVALAEIISMKEANALPVSKVAKDELVAIDQQISDLEVELAKRKEVQDRIDAE